MNKHLWDGKPWQAFKTFAIIFSFVMNLVLLLVLFAAAPLILPIVNDVVNPIVGGLNDSFVDMNEATIRRTIPVSDTIPVVMTVPLQTDTNVRVVEAVPLENVPAQFRLPNGGGMINGTVSLNLPEGLVLPVALDLQVPISETLPVQMDVEAVIPLNETELGSPFSQLQGIFSPLNDLLERLPNSAEELEERLSEEASPSDAEREETAVDSETDASP